MYLYSVGFDIPSISHICTRECFLPSYNSFASCLLSLVSFFGLPPCLPLALADSSPAFVLSNIKFLSNSDNAPNIWNMSFPVELFVLIYS